MISDLFTRIVLYPLPLPTSLFLLYFPSLSLCKLDISLHVPVCTMAQSLKLLYSLKVCWIDLVGVQDYLWISRFTELRISPLCLLWTLSTSSCRGWQVSCLLTVETVNVSTLSYVVAGYPSTYNLDAQERAAHLPWSDHSLPARDLDHTVSRKVDHPVDRKADQASQHYVPRGRRSQPAAQRVSVADVRSPTGVTSPTESLRTPSEAVASRNLSPRYYKSMVSGSLLQLPPPDISQLNKCTSWIVAAPYLLIYLSPW